MAQLIKLYKSAWIILVWLLSVAKKACQKANLLSNEQLDGTYGIGQKGRTVYSGLIIEDTPSAANICAKALSKIDVESTIIDNGRKAIEHLQQTHITPDVILLDMHLPEANGIQIINTIRQQAHLRKTIVILTTSDYEMSKSAESLADFVLLKPISIHQLMTIIKRSLQSSVPLNPRNKFL